MSEYTNERPIDSATDLNLIREQCGTLELALQNETDPARLSDLRRELAECRQRAFEVEQRDQPAAEREAGGTAGDPLPPAAVRGDSEKPGPFVTIEAADPRPDYAGLYAAERIESAELRQELAAEGQGGPLSSCMRGWPSRLPITASSPNCRSNSTPPRPGSPSWRKPGCWPPRTPRAEAGGRSRMVTQGSVRAL